jgi:hypothetical protein
MTDLFAIVSGIPPHVLTGAVPPACRRTVAPATPLLRDGADTVVSLPEWRPRGGALHLVPSFSALTEREHSVRFELSADAGHGWSPWVGAAPLGPAPLPPIPTEVALAPAPATLASEIDLFVATVPVRRARLRLRVRGDADTVLSRTPWMITLSTFDGSLSPPTRGASAAGARLDVPARSQFEGGGDVAHRVCSPACVAMVLGYWGRRVDDLAALAAEMFHPALDLYGVWPAAIRAAARHGIAGYLLRFPDWASAAWCLDRGIPIVASVRYRAGELTGAAVSETPGHLIVLTGYDRMEALVNDPAAPRASAAARRYRIDELERVWLGRTGVGYVLFDPTAA